MKKIISVFIIVSLFVCSLSCSSSALDVTSTYSDVTSTSTQAVNLVNYALSYDSFINSDFVVFCDAQYSYYIVWGDFDYDGVGLSSRSGVEFIHYSRSDSTGSYSYSYQYSVDGTFTLIPDHVCTSNVPGFGFVSSPYQESKFYYDYSLFLVFLGSVLFVILIQHLRRGSYHV